ncbi:MAG: GerMN domain-containing protein [bacterium]
MKIKKYGFFIIIISVLILIGTVLFFLTKEEKIKLKIPFITPKEIVVELYFSSKDAMYLVKEEHRIPASDNNLEHAKEIINELIQGPESKDLFPTIPEGTQIRELYFHKNTAYVDFSSELVKNHPGGSSAEIHTIFSIVNTLTSNFPKIKYVQILVEGREIDTIGGHIDTTLPFKQNLSLIQQKRVESRE